MRFDLRGRLTLLVLGAMLVAARSHATQPDEYLVKAAFLEKLCRFIEWPAGSLDGAFDITVIGRDPFHEALTELARRQPIKKRPIRLHYIRDIEQLGACHLLFIARSELNRVDRILSAVRGRPVLLVSDSAGLAARGVHVNFYVTREDSLHFEMNPAALSQAGLKADSYLLDYAKIVQ